MKAVPDYLISEFSGRTTKYCCLIITLNEGERIVRQIQTIKEYSQIIDLIIVDGDSTDNSLQPDFLRANNINTLLITREQGLSNAIKVGLDYAIERQYSGVVTVDGNGKDGVKALPDFIKALEQGFDLAQGSRFIKGGFHRNTPLERYLAIKYIVAPLISLSGFYYTDPTNGFRAMSKKFLTDPRVQPLRKIFNQFNLQLFMVYRAAQLSFNVAEIPVERVYPEGAVPTKIKKIRTKLLFIAELLATVAGLYNPKAGES